MAAGERQPRGARGAAASAFGAGWSGARARVRERAGAHSGAGPASRLGREVARAAQVSASSSFFFEFCFQNQQPQNTIFEQVTSFFMKYSKHESCREF
jgi:hypothetical protein